MLRITEWLFWVGFWEMYEGINDRLKILGNEIFSYPEFAQVREDCMDSPTWTEAQI